MTLEIRKAIPEDTEPFLALLRQVREAMPRKEWFYLDAPEDVREMLRNGVMKLWLAMDGSRIAGAFDYLLPGLEPYNYGYELNLPEENLRQVVNMDTVAVHPDYRGMGLQRKLIGTAEDSLRREGNRILLCTVHPDNVYSLRNMLALGYGIQTRKTMYGSVRLILRKDLL